MPPMIVHMQIGAYNHLFTRIKYTYTFYAAVVLYTTVDRVGMCIKYKLKIA